MNIGWTANFRRVLGKMAACCLVLSAVTLVGCGSSNTAPVSGKVTYEGKTVTGGSLTFVPIATGGAKNPGKPGSAVIKSDGSYVVGTNSESDGAVIGKHNISFSPPAMETPPEIAAKSGKAPLSGFEGLVPKQAEVEVKSGNNTIDVELVAGPKQ